MKKIADYCLIVILSLLFFPVGVMAQVEGTPPEGFTYQAEARDRDGNAIANTKLSAQIILFQDEINGKIVYRENHKVTTDDFGMFTLVIGNGTSKNNFANIKWGAHSHFMNVKIKRLGDQRAINMGTIQLLSVPYALHAKTAGRVISLGTDPQIKALKARINQLEESALSGTFTDSRDGRKYNWVRIGYQVWMAQNLAYYNDTLMDKSIAYDGDENNIDKYGRLYSWEAQFIDQYDTTSANPSGKKGLCPDGWHMPSMAEWNELTQYIKGIGYEKKDLQAKNGWSHRYQNDYYEYINSNKFSFDALPGGMGLDAENFERLLTNGYWWSTDGPYYDREGGYIGWSHFVLGPSFSIEPRVDYNSFLSIRCIRD